MSLKTDLAKTNGINLTQDGYFPNRGKECGVCSLANLIYYKFKDFDTAKDIFINAKNHPLVEIDNRTNMGTFPILLEELSNNKYSGTLYAHPSYDLERVPLGLKSHSLKKFKESIKDSLERCVVSFEGQFKGKAPYILFLENDHPRLNHALILKNRNYTYINNGQIIHSLLRLNVIGVFDVFKK
jgi:hypothetical protein